VQKSPIFKLNSIVLLLSSSLKTTFVPAWISLLLVVKLHQDTTKSSDR
jgi:hypothetical protein